MVLKIATELRKPRTSDMMPIKKTKSVSILENILKHVIWTVVDLGGRDWGCSQLHQRFLHQKSLA